MRQRTFLVIGTFPYYYTYRDKNKNGIIKKFDNDGNDSILPYQATSLLLETEDMIKNRNENERVSNQTPFLFSVNLYMITKNYYLCRYFKISIYYKKWNF